MKDVWRFATAGSGAQSVTTAGATGAAGMTRMRLLCVCS